jgi:hypothetical protein
MALSCYAVDADGYMFEPPSLVARTRLARFPHGEVWVIGSKAWASVAVKNLGRARESYRATKLNKPTNQSSKLLFSMRASACFRGQSTVIHHLQPACTFGLQF